MIFVIRTQGNKRDSLKEYENMLSPSEGKLKELKSIFNFSPCFSMSAYLTN